MARGAGIRRGIRCLRAADAGTYYVWYRVKGDGNHTDTAAACVKVTIAEPEPEQEPEPEPEAVRKRTVLFFSFGIWHACPY